MCEVVYLEVEFGYSIFLVDFVNPIENTEHHNPNGRAKNSTLLCRSYKMG
jgi:hypothetical protein